MDRGYLTAVPVDNRILCSCVLKEVYKGECVNLLYSLLRGLRLRCVQLTTSRHARSTAENGYKHTISITVRVYV